MKKTFTTIFTAFSLIAAFALSSCSDVIFDEIRKEVKLDDPQISGDIKSIVRFTYNDGKLNEDGTEASPEKLFVCNGKIYYKTADADKCDWTRVENAPSNAYAIAADSEYLYAVALPFAKDGDGYNVPVGRYLYCYSDNEWKKIKEFENTSTKSVLFCTNSVNKANRKAYFRFGTEVFELKGTEEPQTVSEGSVNVLNDQKLTDARNAVWFNGSVYLTSADAIATDATESEYIYYGSQNSVYYSTDAATWTSKKFDCSSIKTIAYTTDYLILGTSDGIEHVSLDNNVPDALSSWSNNAQSALSSYYLIQCVLVVDPSKAESQTNIYASIDFSGRTGSVTPENVGLWSCYPLVKNQWNRE
ncbi:MAG: hypothetical protein KBT11_11480 [Treponema sp.]|nr:hypothetical protein [Candidatus Treponema equifaecale]